MRLKRNHPGIIFSPLLWSLLLFLALKPYTGKTQILSKGYTAQLEAVRDTINSLLKKEKIPSMVIAVTKDGKIIWEEAFGWADKEQQIKATPETIYCLGSMSKSICATGVMTLVENGTVSLEDKVNSLLAPLQLKGYAADADEVKVWHILNMSAGIPHGWTSLSDGQLPEKAVGQKELFERFALVTLPPGKVFHYANYSMGVADVIMEKASGLTVEAYMKKGLFDPLGMKNSLVTYFEANENHQLATPYSSRLNRLDQYQFFPYGGGGYWSSVHDLILYAQFHLKNNKQSILSEANLDLMHHFEQSPGDLFGLGWFNDGVKLISNGSITGFNSCMVLVPSENLGVVVLTNMSSNNAITDQVAFSVVDQLAPELPEGITREKYAELYETPYVRQPELLGLWEGTLRTGDHALPVSFNFGENILIRVADQEEQQLQNPVFTPSKKLEGAFRARLPVPEFNGVDLVETWLHVFVAGNRLVGNTTPMFSNERGSFCYGVYLELRKKQ